MLAAWTTSATWSNLLADDDSLDGCDASLQRLRDRERHTHAPYPPDFKGSWVSQQYVDFSLSLSLSLFSFLSLFLSFFLSLIYSSQREEAEEEKEEEEEKKNKQQKCDASNSQLHIKNLDK